MSLMQRMSQVDFIGKSKISLTLSSFLVIASIVLLFTKGLTLGVDFAGGTIIQLQYESKAPIGQVRETLAKNSMFDGMSVSEFGSPNEIIIRLKTVSKDVTKDMGDIVRKALAPTGDFEVRKVDSVGAKVGSELREKGIMAMVLAIIGILIYVSVRFEWRFAVASVFALVHDVTIAMGMLVLFEVDVNLDTLAALLTILGYSLNDTIIVFDRIREGFIKSKSAELMATINESIGKTLSRTTLTSLTTFFVVLTLFLFGGEIIYGFSFTLLVGVVVGTYSSIFVAAPLLKQFKFSVKDYRAKLAEKEKRAKEKERQRAQFEQGRL